MVKKVFVIAIASAYVLSGCATTGGDGSSTASSDNPERVCNTTLVSILAGLGCALVSSDKHRVRNAALCAAAGYVGCMLTNSYKAKQVKSAKDVESDQIRENRKLPEHATLASYTTNLNPGGAVSKGQKINISSDIVVIPGRNNSSVKIEEEVALLDAVGDQWGKTVRKLANPNGEAGQYQTSFTIPVHQSMSQGVYSVRKAIYLDGVRANSNDKGKFQVVVIDGDTRLAWYQ